MICMSIMTITSTLVNLSTSSETPTLIILSTILTTGTNDTIYFLDFTLKISEIKLMLKLNDLKYDIKNKYEYLQKSPS